MINGLKHSEPNLLITNTDILHAADTRARVMSFDVNEAEFRFMGEERIFESIIMSDTLTSME